MSAPETEPKPTVTIEQARAFVDALTGWEELGDQQARPKSPHALTHLHAVLGAVPSWGDLGLGYVMVDDTALRFAAYLEAVAAAIRAAGKEMPF